jgi:precorrin-4/cobalt-precorrin-4 C11-methyltransferase
MAFYLSVHLIRNIVEELLKAGSYQASTPVAVVYRATWEDEKIIVGTLGDIVEKVREAKITKTAIIIVGNVINPSSYEFSKVYDKKFTHGYRIGDKSK